MTNQDSPEFERSRPRGRRIEDVCHVPFYEFDGAAREPRPGQGSPLGRVELGDILRLKAELAAATQGKGFVLQLGNRADRWENIGSPARLVGA